MTEDNYDGTDEGKETKVLVCSMCNEEIHNTPIIMSIPPPVGPAVSVLCDPNCLIDYTAALFAKMTGKGAR